MSIAKATNDHASAAASDGASNAPARLLFWSGAVLSVSVILVFAAQVFWANLLITPWYLPIGGTAAALLVLYAVSLRRRWWRLVIALGCVGLACLEWLFLLVVTVLPRYDGPIIEGSAVPAFRASLADGSEIDASYFQQRPMTAVVFFQGRWCPFCMTQLRELESHHDEFDRVGAKVVVVSLDDPEGAKQTQLDFPHLTAVSDQRREMSTAIDLINKSSAPDGGDSAAPTILLVDNHGIVRWFHRPTRFIARPSASEIAAVIEKQ